MRTSFRVRRFYIYIADSVHTQISLRLSRAMPCVAQHTRKDKSPAAAAAAFLLLRYFEKFSKNQPDPEITTTPISQIQRLPLVS